jgi:hypothetical protein
MPPLAREQQVAKLRRGELDFIVTTDVIGHGINLPLCSVVFAETDKYDGITRRPLMLWEAAQIAGRAGRGSAPGFVACLRPFMGLSADALLVSRAIAVAAGGAAVAAPRVAAVPPIVDIILSTKKQPAAAPYMPSPALTSSAPAGSGWGCKRFVAASSVSDSDLPEKRALKTTSTAELVSDLKLDFAVMRPSLQDLVRLGASSPFLLPLAMQRWERVFIEKNRDWIRSGDLRTIVQRIDCVTSAMLGRVSHGCNFECALFLSIFFSL